MNPNYRDEHELFMNHHTGSSPEKVLVVSLIMPLAAFALKLVSPWLWTYDASFWVKVITEIVLLVFPLVLCLTIWNSHIILFISSLSAVCLSLILLNHSIKCLLGSRKKTYESNSSFTQSKYVLIPISFSSFINAKCEELTDKPQFITNMRAHVLLVTAISILAVDFPVFPREFAKTEEFGWSLMDVGVGCYVFMNGLVAPEARGKINQNRWTSVFKTFLSSCPLFVLGFGRLVAIKATNYHEHVTEYGVHWNFFLTLALTKVICTISLNALPVYVHVVVPVLYQYLLSHYKMTEYLLSDERKGFLHANKEGLWSLFGYTAIYLFAVQVGKLLFKPRDTLKEWLIFLGYLLLAGGMFWIFMHFSVENIEPCSRRTANLSYVLWMVAFNLIILAVQLAEIILTSLLRTQKLMLGPRTILISKDKEKEQYRIIVVEAISQNALLFFLVANVATGAVNICVQTLYTSSLIAVIILVCYSSFFMFRSKCFIQVFSAI
ncbi:phosphatidylinositol-glycan biosynthesis class W protein-like [Limulus polyphemus]|uniref:Phosphatidylinositol-glycan biosynthesis class W protein n=1 Tax=Limulus polyphemus TaxID=6850 RepID=A0ABM1BIP1_LIMPO|nr:phosphatidylinositol-glycan biosynthesis class W protein-like [Limulus polyphemus]